MEEIVLVKRAYEIKILRPARVGLAGTEPEERFQPIRKRRSIWIVDQPLLKLG